MTKYIQWLALLLITFPATLQARTLSVCDTCAYTSVTSALKSAQSGDLILIYPGTYREGRLIVDKSVHLKGIGMPTLDGDLESEILTVVADDVIIEGIRIAHVGHSYIEDRAGLRIQKSKGAEICDNILDNTFFGIYLEHASNILVENNQLTGEAVSEVSSGNAIHIWYCKNVTVRNNLVTGHRDGIYLEFTEHSEVIRNISRNNLRYGLHFMFSNDNAYEQNLFSENGAGVAVMFSRRIQMLKNNFEKNWGKASYGLLLKEIYDAEISENTFYKNTIGILVEGSNRINYTHNTIERNGWAIKISGGCQDNRIEANNFLNNTFDLSMHSAAQPGLLGSNFWSQYTGYDLDRDGMGDVPYRPVKLYNYVVDKTPEAMILLRSLFIDLLNFAEKVSPVFTPKNVMDSSPSMTPFDFYVYPIIKQHDHYKAY